MQMRQSNYLLKYKVDTFFKKFKKTLFPVTTMLVMYCQIQSLHGYHLCASNLDSRSCMRSRVLSRMDSFSSRKAASSSRLWIESLVLDNFSFILKRKEVSRVPMLNNHDCHLKKICDRCVHALKQV